MADEYLVDHRSTQQHFMKVLALGQGIDMKNFDLFSAKPMSKLFKEIQEQDAILKYNPVTHRVERHARSVRTRIYELRQNIVWIEVARRYPSGQVRPKKKSFSTSETLKPWENGLDGVLRGAARCNIEEMKPVWDKVGYLPKPEDLTPQLGNGGLMEELDEHDSSVYEAVLSIVRVHWVDLYLDFHNPGMSLGNEIIILKDCDGALETNDNWVQTYLRSEANERAA